MTPRTDRSQSPAPVRVESRDGAARDARSSRRAFLAQLAGGGAAAGLASLTPGCVTPGGPGSGCDGGAPAVDAPAVDAPAVDVTFPAPGPRPAVAAEMPFRQDDPAWGDDVMWDRELVIRAAHELNGATLTEARSLLRAFEDGNTIANEGCLLTSLAMVLRLLGPTGRRWTPRTLNAAAREGYYYTPCGLSMTTLYADLVSEVSDGAVQLVMKEEYLAGEPGWARVEVHTSPLVRAYRQLSPDVRADCLVVIKTGTWDDTVASHYLVLHPDDSGGPDDRDPEVLDPAMPGGRRGRWRLSDSARTILADAEIAAAWRRANLTPTQLGGAWVFARWDRSRGRPQAGPLARAWALELAGTL